MRITLGSLFDGIGGFPLAAIRTGIEPLWASEIEAFPIKVTKIRFPEMVHMGNIIALNGGMLPPVDIITGGSPCQDLSIAGKRKGLAGERSGLFMEQIRVVKEMRRQDEQRGRANESIRPRFMCWENVPGAFSSSCGEDFRAVLEEICRIKNPAISIPGPPNRRWLSVGCIMGNQFSLAWRVLDAQYWGVPQRRKRIFLVADFGGYAGPEILFKQEILHRDSKQSKGKGADTSADAGKGSADSGNGIESFGIQDYKGRLDYSEEFMTTMRAGRIPSVLESRSAVVFENHRRDARYQGPLNIAPTVMSCYGTGGDNVPYTLNVSSYCIAGNTIDRAVENGGNGTGILQDKSYTLNTADLHAVFYQQHGFDQFKEADIAGTQTARQYKEATDLICNTGEGGKNQILRRLTPLECERLMGFPDLWTGIDGASDSARYRALGNSVVIPCVEYIMHGIAYFLGKERG